MNSLKYFLILILLFFVFDLNSQRIIKGIVIDAEDSCGLPGVSVQAIYSDLKTVTDSDGNFSLNIPENSDVKYLEFSFLGYEKNRIIINTIRNNFLCLGLTSSATIVAKPVIYLYPQQDTKIEIKLNINGETLNTYPEYENGWIVSANANGDLVNLKDNSKHRYLFWDGLIYEDFHVSDFETGFIVKGEDVQRFLENSLTELGLNDYAKK